MDLIHERTVQAVDTSEALVQGVAESSDLREKFKEIKMNIEKKELDIKREKKNLRAGDSSLDSLAKIAIVLNLVSSDVPLQEHPLDMERSSSKIKRRVKEFFGKLVPADSFENCYVIVESLFSRLAQDMPCLWMVIEFVLLLIRVTART